MNCVHRIVLNSHSTEEGGVDRSRRGSNTEGADRWDVFRVNLVGGGMGWCLDELTDGYSRSKFRVIILLLNSRVHSL